MGTLPRFTLRGTSRGAGLGTARRLVADAPEPKAAVIDSKPTAPSPTEVATRRPRFHDVCSHCHGANGASPVGERALRKLRSRYKDEWRTVASVTIREGHPGRRHADVEGDVHQPADRPTAGVPIDDSAVARVRPGRSGRCRQEET